MFADAYDTASQYTRPVLLAQRTYDGKVSSAVASYIVLNADGWMVTAAHVFKGPSQVQQDAPAIAAYETVRAAEHPRARRRRREAAGATINPGWVTHAALSWGQPGWHVDQVIVNAHADLAVGRIIGYTPLDGAVYPVVRTPGTLRQGTSLCKLGFPFQGVNAMWDENTGFVFPDNVTLTRFPIEGIYTRQCIAQAGNATAVFIETSSPGLGGQSGGPVFDVQGRLCGIQSRTQHIPLGFSPTLTLAGGRQVTENQFLNVGWAADVTSLQVLAQQAGFALTFG